MNNTKPDCVQLERRKLSTRVMAGRAFMIKTPPSQQYMRKMKTWLTTGSQGALVYGRPRLGKTLATRWMLKMLPEALGIFPWIEVPIREQRIASERVLSTCTSLCAAQAL